MPHLQIEAERALNRLHAPPGFVDHRAERARNRLHAEPAPARIIEVGEIAAGIAATAPIASRYTTLALRGEGHADLESCLQWEALAQPVTLATADLQEGILAAREKRPAAFRGV